jgi:hypothetical protein
MVEVKPRTPDILGKTTEERLFLLLSQIDRTDGLTVGLFVELKGVLQRGRSLQCRFLYKIKKTNKCFSNSKLNN